MQNFAFRKFEIELKYGDFIEVRLRIQMFQSLDGFFVFNLFVSSD